MEQSLHYSTAKNVDSVQKGKYVTRIRKGNRKYCMELKPPV